MFRKQIAAAEPSHQWDFEISMEKISSAQVFKIGAEMETRFSVQFLSCNDSLT